MSSKSNAERNGHEPLSGAGGLAGEDRSPPGQAPEPPRIEGPPDRRATDPFDPTKLRLGQDFVAAVGVKRLVTTIRVDKPPRDTFIRTHPDPGYRLQTCVIELKSEREMYLVANDLWADLAGESAFVPKLLVAAVTRQGVPFLWPLRLPGPDGKADTWCCSALMADEAARADWVRVQADMDLNAYRLDVATGITIEPVFPDLPLGEILKVAFKDKLIQSLDHPVLRKLRGEL